MTPSPTGFRSNFLNRVSERGYVHQCTDLAALDALLADGEKDGRPIVGYIGFDCTAASLHVGSLIQIMMLRHWQLSGHKPVVLMGGGTTKIGDPSGKDETRQMLTEAKIAENMAGIRKVFERYLDFGDAANGAVMVDNAEWLDGLGYLAFLREYGRLFSVNRMLAMDSVRLRLERESHLSFLEFNYMILQAYDFVELSRRYGCRVQFGGSDQWGNIVQGVDLHHKCSGESGRADGSRAAIASEAATATHGERARQSPFGLTTPLLTTASGAKMGKTASGAVWLDAAMLTPFDYWQFWRNVEDADTGRFLRLFTDLPIDEIARLEALPGQEINQAKKILATEATALLHGREAAERAAETARQTFEQGATAETLPEAKVEVAERIAAFQLFVAAGLAASGGEARRLIQGGGAKVNDVLVEGPNSVYTRERLLAMEPVKLSAGKKKHVRLVVV